MAPTLPIDKVWEQYGWWIAVDAASKPVLWLTEHPFQIGKCTSALGKSFAKLQAINIRPGDMIYAICVPGVGQTAAKTSLSKKLLLAHVPIDLL